MDEKIISPDTELNSTIKKEVDDISSIIRETVMDFHNYVFPKYILNYKTYLWFVADRIAHIESWQSNINYPMVSATVDTMFGNIFDFGYEFWIKELWLKQLCTKAFDFRWTGKKVFKEVVKEVLICWKGYVKDYFVKEEVENTFFDEKIKQTIKMPSLTYISVFDVMYDRTKWLDNSSYKIIRTFASWDTIKQKVLPMLSETTKIDRKNIELVLNKWLSKTKDNVWNRFSVYDYNPVKWLLATQQWMDVEKIKDFYKLPIVSKVWDLVAWYWNDWTVNSETTKNYFLNNDKSCYELVEYITNDKRTIFVNWYLFYHGPKLTNIWDIREATYSIIPWTGNAIWAADKQLNLQQIQNTLWNAFIDNLKLNLWPMFKVTGNLPMSKNWTIDFRAFKMIKTNWSWDIEKIQMWSTDFAPMNFMQMVEAASQKETWMTNYVMWWGWAIERTQWWIDLKFNQYKSKLTPITDSIDQMMWNIARSWIQMYLKFYTIDELKKLWIEVEKVFEPNEKWVSKFKTILLNKIDIKDIIDETNITFTYNSLDKVTKESIRWNLLQNLQYLLQYAWQSLDMQEVAKVLAWIDFDPTKLFKKERAAPDVQQAWWELTNIEPEAEEPQEDLWEMSDEDILAQLQNIS